MSDNFQWSNDGRHNQVHPTIHTNSNLPPSSPPPNKPINFNKPKLNKGLLAILAILIVGVAVPVTVLFSRYTQQTQQNAQINNIGPHDSCNKLTITWKENIQGANSCPQNQKNPNITSYGVTINVASNDGKQHVFHYITYKNYCTGNQVNPTCMNSTPGIAADGKTSQSIVIGPTQMNKCGAVQDDFVITTVDGSGSCHYGSANSTPNGSSGPGGAGFCGTGIACQAPSPTVTQPPSPSPTNTCNNTKVTLDAKNVATGANVTQLSWKHTTGSNNNMILVVGIGADNGSRNTSTNPDPATAVTYNGQALTKVLEKDCNLTKCSNEIWYMMNPPQGQHTINVQLTAAGSVNAGSATFYNIDPNNPFADPATGVNNGNPSVVVPNTNSSQLIFDVATLDDDVTNLNSAHGASNLWSSRDSNQLTINGGQYTPAQNGTTTVGWNATAPYPEEYSDIAIPLNAVSSNCVTPTVTPSPTPIVSPTPTPTLPPGITPTPTPTIPACQANQASCQWQASNNATQYNVTITDKTTGQVTTQTINAPQTFASFPSVVNHSYTCQVSGANSCGVGSAGTGTFTCTIPSPTPTSCPAPQAPNVQISCPNCGN